MSWVFSGSLDNLAGSWPIHHLNHNRKLAWTTVPAVVWWTIWKEKNARIFEGKTEEIKDIFQKAKWRLCVWLCSNKEFKDLKASDLF